MEGRAGEITEDTVQRGKDIESMRKLFSKNFLGKIIKNINPTPESPMKIKQDK